MERDLLESLKFRFNFAPPFDFLIQLCSRSRCSKVICKEAFLVLYDLYQCPVVCKLSLYHLTLASLYISAKMNDMTLQLPMEIRDAISDAHSKLREPCKEFANFFSSKLQPGTPAYAKYRNVQIALNKNAPLLEYPLKKYY